MQTVHTMTTMNGQILQKLSVIQSFKEYWLISYEVTCISNKQKLTIPTLAKITHDTLERQRIA